MDSLRTAFATATGLKKLRDDISNEKPIPAINAGLWLDKYLSQQDVKQAESSSEEQPESSSRTALVQEVANIAVPESYGKFYKIWERELQNHYQADLRVARAKGRMIVGLGEESVIETAIALHHTYGVPYIPGSSLKGLTATYLRQQLLIIQQNDKKRCKDEQQPYKASQQYKEYQQAQQVIFGQTEDAGYITFCDALYIPESAIKEAGEADCPLHQDIITVHHQQYYQGSEPPKDYESPIPVPFLSATGSYLVALAAPDLQEEFRQPWIKATYSLLGLALEHNGIGAKTSSGYGRMKLEQLDTTPPEEEKQPVDQTALQIGGYINEIKALPDNPSIAGQIPTYHQHWLKFKEHERSKFLAQAIIDKVKSAGREKDTRDKSWYKALVRSVQE